MFRNRFVGVVATSFLGVMPAVVLAQSPNGEPREYPPESYTANQYVDSDGCAFIRAGVSGATNWVPRVNRERSQLCGFQPSLAAAPVDDTPPVIEESPVTAPRVAQTAPPVVAPTVLPPNAGTIPRTPDVGPPIETVAGLTAAPRVTAPVPAPRPAPVRAPTPAVVPMPAAPPAPRPTVTLAQACEGRSGVQPGFVSATTGEPIDCGPAPQAVAAVTPSVVADGPRRVTLEEICAEIATTGGRFLDVGTGREVDCSPLGPVAPPVLAAGTPGPAVPGGAIAPIAPVAAPVAGSGQQLYGCNSRFMRCGPQVQSPSGVSSAIGAVPTTHTVARTPAALELILPPEVPASNPVGSVARDVRPPAGYERVWDDGRVNPARGLPPQATATQIVAPAVVATVSTRPAPVAAAGHRYVQVGTYGEPGNARAAVGRLAAMGLPVGQGQVTRDGRVLQIVAAGPFADAAALRQAFGAVRAAGYGDAFTRG